MNLKSKARTPLRPLTLYAFDHRVTNLAAGKRRIKPGAGEPHTIYLKNRSRAAYYIPEPREKEPTWRELFKGHIEDQQYLRLMNRSTRALVLLEVEGYVFAATFGHSKHFIDYEYVRRGFGLKVVVNAVPADKLNSLDMRQFERLSMHTRRQTVKEEPLTRFGLDWSQDILRAVTGAPRDVSFAVRASGADALVLNTRYHLEDLAAVCRRCLEYYESQEYQNTPFKYIDWFQPETDKETIEELDQTMVGALLRGDPLDRPELSIDQIVEPDMGIDIQFETNGRIHAISPNMENLRVFLLQKEGTDHLQLLKQGRVIAQRDESVGPEPFSLYTALTWEHSLDDQDFLLIGGTWIRVDHDYAARVREQIKKLPAPRHPLSSVSATANEDLFIDNICHSDLDLLSLQGLVHKSDSMGTTIELCDIIGTTKTLYCIKSGNKSRSLNHLFRQGHGAGITMLADRVYLSKCLELITEAVRRCNRLEYLDEYLAILSESPFDPSKYEFCFCVLKNRTDRWPLCIPYLAQITLSETAARLSAAGFRVSLQCIHVPPPPRKKPESQPIRRARSTPTTAI